MERSPHPGRRGLHRFEVGEGGTGRIVDFVAEPHLDQAGWMYGEGIVHHTAFQVADYDVQTSVKSHLEGIGFTDVSERDRATSNPSTCAPRRAPSSRRPSPSPKGS